MATVNFLTPVPAFNSDAQDGLATRLDQLKGLASCLVVLGKHESQHLLHDDAISQLGYVMIELAQDAQKQRGRMWKAYVEVHRAAEVTHG